MRIKLILEHQPNQTLLIDYRYYLSIFFYKILSEINQKYADDYHNNVTSKKVQSFNYKEFCFSGIYSKNTSFLKESSKLLFKSTTSVMYFSIANEELTNLFLKGLFLNKAIDLPNSFHAKIQSIEIEEKPVFSSKMCFRTVSPLNISIGMSDRPALHAPPTHPDFAENFEKSVSRKYAALNNLEYKNERGVKFTLIDYKGKCKLHRVRDIKTRGFLFDFQLEGNKDIIEKIYYAGFGAKCSGLGFGFTKIINF